MLDTLNPAQREAIRYRDGPCLVIAGAGSGKTRVITQKIASLIEAGYPAHRITAITFTNKAASEMAERFGRLHKNSAENSPTVCTFHSLGVQILRREGKAIGLKPGFSILDADDAYAILQEALVTTDRKLIRAAQSCISLWKNAMLDAEAAAAVASNDREAVFARAFRSYEATLRAYQAVDFDDLILRPVRLFAEHPASLAAWRERISYLLIDEYQDTNACQYELLRLLTQPRCAFTAVGDDDQSIYGWRGATLENLKRLATDFPDLKVIKLEQNYRSSRSILEAANRLIARNPKLHDKTLWSEHGPGDPLTVVACDDDEQEAESVVMRLQAHKFERRSRFADYAILYRGNHQAKVFEQTLRKEHIPYVLSGGQSFFDRAEIRDLLAYLRLLVNEDDDPAFIRAGTTPKRGIGTSTLQALGEYAGQRQISMFAALFESGFESKVAARQLAPLREFGAFINRITHRASREPAAQVLDDLVQAIDYRTHIYGSFEDKVAAARWQNVSDFLDWLKARAAKSDESRATLTLQELAQQVSLLTQLDHKGDEADAVRLTTIHASKGLEFGHVFVVGCEEGLLPHLGDADESDTTGGAVESAAAIQRIEEERRLMYVAVTRAQRSLTLTWCRRRKRARETVERQPSRFIEEMGQQPKAASTRTVSQDEGRARLANLRALLVSRPTK